MIHRPSRFSFPRFSGENSSYRQTWIYRKKEETASIPQNGEKPGLSSGNGAVPAGLQLKFSPFRGKLRLYFPLKMADKKEEMPAAKRIRTAGKESITGA